MKYHQELQAGNGTEVNSVLHPILPFDSTLWLSFTEVLTDIFFSSTTQKRGTKLNLIFTKTKPEYSPQKAHPIYFFPTISCIHFNTQMVQLKYVGKIKTAFFIYGNGLIFPDNHWLISIKQSLYMFTKECCNCNSPPWWRFPQPPVETPEFTKTILNKKNSF